MTDSASFVPGVRYQEGFRYADRRILPSGKKGVAAKISFYIHAAMNAVANTFFGIIDHTASIPCLWEFGLIPA